MKLKSSRNVDPRQGLAVDSAFLVCKPPEHSLAKRSKQKPQRQYMRYLVHDLLSEDELKQVPCSDLTAMLYVDFSYHMSEAGGYKSSGLPDAGMKSCTKFAFGS